MTIREWMGRRGWIPLPFQEEVWGALARGRGGLLHAGTGSGKTLAVAGGLLGLLQVERGGDAPPPLTLLWLTPLRALARDTAGFLEELVGELGLPWRVELRTGDSSPALRARQRRSLPTVLVTTPESLTLLLTHPDGARRFGALRLVVVDEWHELLGSKRGVQTELALARIRRWAPEAPVWGLSATLGNPAEAAAALPGAAAPPLLVSGPPGEPPEVETLLPDDAIRFPWAGHLGTTLLPRVVDRLQEGGTALLFTNTRYQAEQWFRGILEARPGWRGQVALHHGSLDREVREEAEEGIRSGALRLVVCTSTLDLGVDFAPVDLVVQVGSPRGVGRLLQRAGRSGHRPGLRSRVLCVPTHALEVAEFAAAREAMAEGRLEPRRPLLAPLDVLAQHLVTVALGEGFREEDLLAEVRTSHAYRTLTREEWEWTLDFVVRGGSALRAYPRFSRVVRGEDGCFRVESPQVARMHRASVGTITSASAMEVRFLKGGRLGTVEESFVSRLKPGDRFLFGGRALELVRVREMTAWVRKSGRGGGVIPRWGGGRLPLSAQLGTALLELLERRGEGGAPPELEALDPLLELQDRWSRVPGPGELLVERTRSREGYHLFLYPFQGRLAHEGLGTLMAYRLTRSGPRSVGVAANDYGLELVSPHPFPRDEALDPLLSLLELAEDLVSSLNAAELARRRFREVARVAGLLFQGYPGAGRPVRHLQASGELLFDVLERYDPENLLLRQARREVLEETLELERVRRVLSAATALRRRDVETPRLTPFAFPIWAERIQAELSSESWVERVQRMAIRLERAASRKERTTAAGRGG